MILPVGGFSQSDGNFRNTFKLSPLRVVNITEPGIEAAYEYRFNERWSAQLNTGLIFRLADKDIVTKQNGYSLGVEARQYSRNGEWFIGESVSYAAFNANCRGTFQTGASDSLTYTDAFQLKKDVAFFTARIGRTVELSRRLRMELTFGLSVVYRDAVQTEREDPGDLAAYPYSLHAWRHGVNEGAYWFFRLPGQVRFCYSF